MVAATTYWERLLCLLQSPFKDWLADKKMAGTIRFYGIPAEEGGGGKLYMIRAGVFKDVDTVLSRHPSGQNGASLMSSLAIISAKFRFYGKPAHAAAAPLASVAPSRVARKSPVPEWPR